MRVIRFFKNELIAEVSDWADQDLISIDQANAILHKYDGKYGQKTSSTGSLVLYSLSILFIGLSLFLLLSHNWVDIPRTLRFLILVCSMLGSNLIGFYFHRKERMAPAVLWYCLGSLIYGASIFLVGQMYHLSEQPTEGLLWWSLGLLPLALAVESTMLMLIYMFVSAFWFYCGLATGSLFWGYAVFLLTQTWFILYKRESTFLFLIALAQWIVFIEMAITTSFVDGHNLMDLSAFHMYCSAGLFVLISNIASYVETISKRNTWTMYAFSARLWAVRSAIVTLLVFSFDEMWTELIRGTARLSEGGALVTGATVLVCVLGSLAFAYADAQSKSLTVRAGFTRGSVVFSLAFALCCVFCFMAAGTSLSNMAIILQIFTNVFAVGTGIYLISQSFDKDSAAGYVAGLSVLLAIGLLRYIDLIGDYLGGSALFFVFGIVLLGSGYYRTRGTARYVHHEEVV